MPTIVDARLRNAADLLSGDCQFRGTATTSNGGANKIVAVVVGFCAAASNDAIRIVHGAGTNLFVGN